VSYVSLVANHPIDQRPQFATMEEVKALIFDVFGTVVDWRGSIVRELEVSGKEHGLALGALGLHSKLIY